MIDNKYDIDFDFSMHPVRTELTVLPADSKRNITLGWIVKDNDGSPIFLKDAWDINLTDANSIKIGDTVYVPSVMGYIEMIVKNCNNDEGEAESNDSLAPLHFSKDDRKCWTSNCLIAKKYIND